MENLIICTATRKKVNFFNDENALLICPLGLRIKFWEFNKQTSFQPVLIGCCFLRYWIIRELFPWQPFLSPSKTSKLTTISIRVTAQYSQSLLLKYLKDFIYIFIFDRYWQWNIIQIRMRATRKPSEFSSSSKRPKRFSAIPRSARCTTSGEILAYKSATEIGSEWRSML